MMFTYKGFKNGNNICVFKYIIINDVTEATSVLESVKSVTLFFTKHIGQPSGNHKVIAHSLISPL